jgi:dihydrofolate reductase
VLSGDATEEVRALKEQPGKDTVLTGSISLGHTLIEGGPVDEYRLFVYPVVQGRGRRLFPDAMQLPRLRPVAARTFRSGVAFLHHAAT